MTLPLLDKGSLKEKQTDVYTVTDTAQNNLAYEGELNGAEYI